MKFLIEVRIPTDVGNEDIRDGVLLQELGEYLEMIKPDAVYYTLRAGGRCILLIVDIETADRISSIAEPFWLNWEAEVRFIPLITAEEFEKAGTYLQQLIRSDTIKPDEE